MSSAAREDGIEDTRI